jgi:filamentous hemagglutinin family protein
MFHEPLVKRRGADPRKVVSAVGLSFLLLLSQSGPLLGNPTGGVVAAGSASIGSAGNTLTVSQATAAAIINWQQFSISSGELTKFIVPSSSAATLNRVLGGNPSAIYGALQSNGKVFLINPSGIVVGPNGRIDTAGFLGSTLDVSDDEFLKGGDLHFIGTGSGSIDNEGVIHASSGDVYLIANQVTNGGKLEAPRGNVGLAAGTQVLFQQAGDQHLFVQANNPSTPRAVGVTNSGTVFAATAELKAAGGNAYALAINNTGQITANGFKKINGQVYLTSDGGNITNAGQISAHNPNGDGGTIVLNGHGTTSVGTVLNSGKLVASGKGKGTQGGTVEVLGNQVGIIDNGLVDVSGDAGGGTALIGGDEHGSNPDVVDADQTYLGPDATITADAFTLGNGGKIILWGNESTQAYGSISAQGGSQGGNGGFVETSAPYLDVQTSPKLSAPQGSGGTWLLDPYNLTISSSSTTGIEPAAPFALTSGPANLDVTDLQDDLQGTNETVEIDTGSADNGNDAGNITWESGATLSTSSTMQEPGINNGTLILTGPGEILLNGATISGTGSLNLVLNSTVSATSSDTFGNVVIEDSALSLGGGNLSVVGTGRVDSTDNTYVDGVNIFGSSQIDAGGGNIFISGQVFNTAPTVTGGYFGVFVEDSTVQTSGSGTLSVIGTVGTVDAPLSSHTQMEGVGLNFFNADTGTNVLETADGALSVTGDVYGSVTQVTNGSSSGYSVTGVDVRDNTQVETTGLGSLTLLGDASGATTMDNDNGVAIEKGGSVFTLGASTGISITGTGGTISGTPSGSGAQTIGIEIQGNGSVAALGTTPVTLMGTGGTDDNITPTFYSESYGVSIDTPVNGGQNIVSSIGGAVMITGIGGASPNESDGFSIGNGDNLQADGLSEITSDTGGITIDGSILDATTVTGSYGHLSGVQIQALSQVMTNSGAISITGTVDEPQSNGIALNATGVVVSDALVVANQAGGSISILGDVSGTTTDASGVFSHDDAIGVLIGFGGASPVDTAVISVADGDSQQGLSITGYGGTLVNTGTDSGHSPSADGIIVGEGASLTALVTAPITLTGQGGYDGLSNTTLDSESSGIVVSTDQASTTTSITASAGTISLLGTAGTSLTAAAGVELFSEDGGANSISSSSGNIIVTGLLTSAAATTAFQLEGVDLTGKNTIDTEIGLIHITGTVSAGNGLANSNINGVNIMGNATIEATGSVGSIKIEGDSLGSVADGTNANDIGGNIGTNIQGYNYQSNTSGAVSISVGSTQTPSSSTTGILITGTGGTLDTNGSTVNSPTADGIDITQGVSISANGSAPVYLQGTGGTNTNSDGADLGEAQGIDFTTDLNGSIGISTDSGLITLVGNGGASLNSGVGVLIGGTNLTAAISNPVTASIESNTGDIVITGVGGTGYVGSGMIVGQYVPNFGIAIGDYSTVSTGGAITLTGTGSGNSAGVAVMQLPAGSFGDVHPAPVITSGGVFTATALSNTGVYLNAAVTAGSVALGTETSSSPITITSGNLDIVNSTITLTGGDLTAYGAGTGTLDASNVDGIDVSGATTINAQGGNISLTGLGGNYFDGQMGGFIAGRGVHINDGATLESADPGQSQITSGDITIFGDGTQESAGSPLEVLNALSGVGINDGTLSVVDGALSITGQVTAGIADDLVVTENSDGPVGVHIHGDSTIESTGTGANGGSVTIIGNTSGTTSRISTGTSDADNTGVQVEGAGTYISVADGTAGLSITGTAGTITSNQTTTDSVGGYSSIGVHVHNGAVVEALGTAPIALTGNAGANTSLTGQNVGASMGVLVEGNTQDAASTAQVSSSGGTITITGTAADSANVGTGIVVIGRNGGTAGVTSDSGDITFIGTGGAGNPGADATSGISFDNDGVAVLDGATVQSNSGSLSFSGEAGAGDPAAVGVIAKPFISGDITSSSLPVINAGSGALQVTSSVGGIIFDAIGTSISPVEASSATFASAGNLTLENSDFTVAGIFNASGIGASASSDAVDIGASSIDASSIAVTAQTGRLDINGAVQASGPVTMVDNGGNIVFAPAGSISDAGTGNNVVLAAGTSLAGAENIFNNSTVGGNSANAIQTSGGSHFYLYSDDPTDDTLGGLAVSSPNIVYNATYPQSGLSAANENLFFISGGSPPSNPVVPTPVTPNPVTPPVIPPIGDLPGGTLPPVVAAPITTVVTPPVTSTGVQAAQSGATQPPPFTFTGDGVVDQGATQTGGLADSSGNGGQVGSGDAVQLNNGQMNTVTNPAAAGALDSALSFAVHNTLADAMKGLDDWVDTETSGDDTDSTAQDNSGEKIIDSGGVVEIDSGGVKSIPLSDAPQSLQNALGDGVLGGLQSKAGH